MLRKNKMLYGLLILFVGFAMSFNTATAQVGEGTQSQGQNAFTGMVVDAQTGQPVANATVKVEGTDMQVTTNENGMFKLENVGQTGGQSGLTIVINHQNYQKMTKTVQPMQNQGQQPMTFELEPKQGQGQGQGQEGDY